MENNTTLLSRVQHALKQNINLRNCLASIYVQANDDAVVLSGSVDTPSMKKLAKEIVASLPGIGLVVEELEISPTHKRIAVHFDWVHNRMKILN